MAVTFIVNPGSTSKKYSLYQDGVCLVVVHCESTGTGFSMSVIGNGVKLSEVKIHASEFIHSVPRVLAYLVEQEYITSVRDVSAVGIRVVAPGTFFTEHRTIDPSYIAALRKIEDVAPLHIPGLIDEIQEVCKIFPDVPLWGVSDSAFHKTIPKHIRTISIPKDDAEKFDIQRFGYHGLSFSSIARRLTAQFGCVPENVIVCHIGGGVSIAALKNGESIATSMGYSPVSGMIMGSRGGDITAGVVAALTVFKRLKGKKLYEYLYKESGFKGVAGVSDLRLILERKACGDADAILAFDMFTHEFRSWIAMHAATLGGVDAIVLTATASVRNPDLRREVLGHLSLFGIEIDEEKNSALINAEGCIHHKESKVKIAVMKTDEMGEIDQEMRSL